MKHLIGLVGCFLLGVSCLFAQEVEYTPFDFENNPEWYELVAVEEPNSGDFPPLIHTWSATIKNRIEGDTIIEGNQYFKLYGGGDLIYNTSESMFDENYFLIGYVREFEKKLLYMIPENGDSPVIPYSHGFAANTYADFEQGTEYVLYDFNMEIGDSMSDFVSPNFMQVEFTLDSISSLQIDQDTLNTWHFSNDYISQIWVEGIGGLKGLLCPSKPNFAWEFAQQPFGLSMGISATTCFYSNDIEFHNDFIYSMLGLENYFEYGYSLYNSAGVVKCDAQIYLNEIREGNHLSELLVFPSPANDFVNIKTSLNSDFPINTVLYNSKGMILLREGQFSEEFTIDVSKLEPGIYFLSIEGVIKKVIIN